MTTEIEALKEEIKDLRIFLESAFKIVHDSDLIERLEHDTSDMCSIPWCVGARSMLDQSGYLAALPDQVVRK